MHQGDHPCHLRSALESPRRCKQPECGGSCAEGGCHCCRWLLFGNVTPACPGSWSEKGAHACDVEPLLEAAREASFWAASSAKSLSRSASVPVYQSPKRCTPWPFPWPSLRLPAGHSPAAGRRQKNISQQEWQVQQTNQALVRQLGAIFWGFRMDACRSGTPNNILFKRLHGLMSASFCMCTPHGTSLRTFPKHSASKKSLGRPLSSQAPRCLSHGCINMQVQRRGCCMPSVDAQLSNLTFWQPPAPRRHAFSGTETQKLRP